MKGANTDTLTVKTKLQVIFKHDNLYSVSCLVNPEERDKSLDRMLAEVVSVDSLYRTSSCSQKLGYYIYKAIELCTQGYTIQIVAETLSINTQRALYREREREVANHNARTRNLLWVDPARNQYQEPNDALLRGYKMQLVIVTDMLRRWKDKLPLP